MSKSKKKHSRKPADMPSESGINTLGIDIEPADLPEEFPAEAADQPSESASESPHWEPDNPPAGFELSDDDLELPGEQVMPLADKIISYATLALSMLLLGGSIVFWFVIGRLLATDPDRLADSGQMRAILISCAILPVIVTAAQMLLRRPLIIERWLINMCISGAAAAMIVVIYLMVFRGDAFGFADYFTLLCCTVSGCTLPSALCMGVRWLIPIIGAKLADARAARSDTNWDDVSEDVCTMTDFEL